MPQRIGRGIYSPAGNRQAMRPNMFRPSGFVTPVGRGLPTGESTRQRPPHVHQSIPRFDLEAYMMRCNAGRNDSHKVDS